MRNKLKNIGKDSRHIFTGIFERIGTKNGYKGILQTVLLLDIRDESNNIITKHLWFNFTKGFQKAKMEKGDKIQFSARVSEYIKGYQGYRTDVFKPLEQDYKLSYPNRIINLTKIIALSNATEK